MTYLSSILLRSYYYNNKLIAILDGRARLFSLFHRVAFCFHSFAVGGTAFVSYYSRIPLLFFSASGEPAIPVRLISIRLPDRGNTQTQKTHSIVCKNLSECILYVYGYNIFVKKEIMIITILYYILLYYNIIICHVYI